MCFMFFFLLQAVDGIRDYKVTGVQTCALPISAGDAPTAAAPCVAARCGMSNPSPGTGTKFRGHAGIFAIARAGFELLLMLMVTLPERLRGVAVRGAGVGDTMRGADGIIVTRGAAAGGPETIWGVAGAMWGAAPRCADAESGKSSRTLPATENSRKSSIGPPLPAILPSPCREGCARRAKGFKPQSDTLRQASWRARPRFPPARGCAITVPPWNVP